MILGGDQVAWHAHVARQLSGRINFVLAKKNEYIDSEGICHHSYDKYLDPVRYSMFDEERWKDQNENSTSQSQVHEALFQVSFKSNSNEVLPCFHKSHHIFAAKNNNIVDAKSMENLEILFQKTFYKWLVERVKTEKFTHFSKVTSMARKQKGKTLSSVNFLNFVGNLDDRLLMRCFTALATGYLFSELRYLSLHNPNLERDILRPFVMTEVCLKWLHDRSGKNKSPAIMQEILADQLTAMGIPVNVMTVLCKLSIVSHPNTVANKIQKCATSRLLEGIKVRENTAFAAIFDNIGFVKKSGKGGYDNWTLMKRHEVSNNFLQHDIKLNNSPFTQALSTRIDFRRHSFTKGYHW